MDCSELIFFSQRLMGMPGVGGGRGGGTFGVVNYESDHSLFRHQRLQSVFHVYVNRGLLGLFYLLLPFKCNEII